MCGRCVMYVLWLVWFMCKVSGLMCVILLCCLKWCCGLVIVCVLKVIIRSRLICL